MKTFFTTISIIVLLFSTCLAADSSNWTMHIIPINSVEGPLFADRDEIVHFEVSYYNGFSSQLQFTETSFGHTKTIELEAWYRKPQYRAVLYTRGKGRPPMPTLTRNTVFYSFQSSEAGTFYFVFNSSKGHRIVHTLTIR